MSHPRICLISLQLKTKYKNHRASFIGHLHPFVSAADPTETLFTRDTPDLLPVATGWDPGRGF